MLCILSITEVGKINFILLTLVLCHKELYVFNNLKLCCCSKGYFIEPTIVETLDPEDRIMVEEIFGPVLSVFVYREKDLESTLRLVGESTPYALTGAVFATDQ